MGDIPVEIALSIRAEHAEGPLGDAATARLWRVNIIGVIFRCRLGVTGPPSPRYAGVPRPPAPWPVRGPGQLRPEKGGTP